MKTEIITDNIDRASEIILAGGLVAVPTETVYGLAGNAMNERAVRQIYEVKGRPEIKPLSLMVPDAAAMERYCVDVPEQAKTLASKFWPGPLTIVLRAKADIPGIVLANGTTVGLRCPDHPLTLALLRKCAVPLAAPSANPSGEPSPKSAQRVLEYFHEKIDGVMDGGQCGVGTESTIIDMTQTPYKILRHAALPDEAVFSALTDAMTLIGITGGTGCGKTTALGVLRKMGAEIIDCDEVYHELTCSSEEMKNEICERFGNVYSGGKLDRKKLGGLVFSDAQALSALNRITHRFVDAEIARRLTEHALRGGRLAAIDAIALLENQFSRRTAFNVAITAPVEARVERLIRREGVTEEYARMRIAAQKSSEYFAENCDYVLENGADISAFEDKCTKFFTEVLKNVR